MEFPVFVMAVLATAIHVLLFLSNKKKHVDPRLREDDEKINKTRIPAAHIQPAVRPESSVRKNTPMPDARRGMTR